MSYQRWQCRFAAALLAAVVLQGCDRQQNSAAPPPPPVPEVAIVTVQTERVVLTTVLPGRTSAYGIAEIRPQVNGLVQKRLFAEGSDVKAGDVLYEIDSAPFKAVLDNAVANLEVMKKTADRARAAQTASRAAITKQKATLDLARTSRQRFEDLLKDKAVSTADRDQAVTGADVAQAALQEAEAQVESDGHAVSMAEAGIKQAEAGVETARINLAYTRIAAPISGRIGRSAVTSGAIVTAYQPVAMATIQQLDPIYVDVPQSTVELNRLKRSVEKSGANRGGAGQNKVKLIQEDGTAYPSEGTLKLSDVTVDPTTGSVILRIIAPNPDGTLLPGMFVRAAIEEGVEEHAIMVPQQAVSRNPKGNPMVLTVDAAGAVQPRPIVAIRAIGDRWLVSSGLAPGDRIVMEGMQRVRPGMVVKVVPFVGGPKQDAQPASTAPASQPK
jgi:membrane fusion protein (multidrug efflux system)